MIKWNEPTPGRYLSIKEVVTFGMYTLGNSFIVSAINYVVTITNIPYFYNISALHGYIIVALGSLLNLIIQPIIGNLMEKTKSKFGKYKPFILFSLPFFAVLGVICTWIPQMATESARGIYAYITCIPLLFLSTFSNNMYQTMPSVITPVSQERADIMVPIGLIVGFAPSLLQIIAGPIRAYFMNQGKEYFAMRLIGIIAISIGACMVMFIIKVKERVYVEKKEKEEKLKFSKAFGMLRKNKPLMILSFALCIGSMREFARQFFQLMIQYRFAETQPAGLNLSGFIMTIVGFGATVSMILFPIVTRKLNKNVTIIIFISTSVLAFGLFGILGYDILPIGKTSAITLTAVYFITAINPTYLLVPIMLGELSDYQQTLTGKKMAGHIQALLFSAPMLVSNVLMILSWFAQRKIGFEIKDYTKLVVIPDYMQAIAVEWFNIASIISAISGLLMIIVLCFYPLSRSKYKLVVNDLKATANLEVENEGIVEVATGEDSVEVVDSLKF